MLIMKFWGYDVEKGKKRTLVPENPLFSFNAVYLKHLALCVRKSSSGEKCQVFCKSITNTQT